MPMQLFAHPFSSFSQKALIAFYENDVPFEYRVLDRGDGRTMAEFKALWPLERFPILLDEDRTVVEATAIIEYLAIRHPGPIALVPGDASAAVDVRMMDRVFDLYVSTAQARIVFNAIRPEGDRDPYGDREARAMLDAAYRWLDGRMKDRTWASGDAFSMADCAAAPALFYADWTHPIDASFENLHAYRRRLLSRPSFARAVDEARPYRSYFPLGAPDRD